MIRSFFIILLTLVSLTSYGQGNAIKGRVIDARTFKPLPFATVYLNQTTIGTVTNPEGDFELTRVPAGRYDLVVSYVGYAAYQNRVTVNDSTATFLSIKLTLSTTNLDEILVKSTRDKAWTALYEKFKKHFFGISPYSSECKIINPWVLDLKEDESRTLTANAGLPLEIENLGLGYMITCHLKEFAVGPKLYKISGTYQFTEAQTRDESLSALWHQRRGDVYHGSVRHLFRSIVDGNSREQGFDLYLDKSDNPELIRNSSFLENINKALVPLNAADVLELGKQPNQFSLRTPSRIEIHYLKKSATPKIYRTIPHPVSWIEVGGGSIDINSQGIVMNPARLTVSGAMGEPHIAELLPIDYQPEVVNQTIVREEKKTYSRLAALLEKPYVMTDKPYYYAADIIFFKAFFNYVSPVYRDSLSHVMRIELIDSDNHILQSKLFPIIAGSSQGNLSLPASIQPGDYYIRAYTRWMLNFDKQLIFTRPFKVLPNNQLGVPADARPVVKNLSILTEKDEFEPREKITIALEATNFYGYTVPAELSVSVVDIEQAAQPAVEKTILSDFGFTRDMLPDSTLTSPKWLIQYGIDFKGQMFYGKKKKPTAGVLTVYQDDVADVFAVPTAEDGTFHQQFQLMDSTELLVAAKTSKGKTAKILVETVDTPSAPLDQMEPLALVTQQTSDPQKYHVTDLYSTAKMLEAVTIEARKIERVAADKKQLFSDTHIDGDYLRSTNATDLLSALRGRIPGLQVLYINNGGEILKYLCFPGIVGGLSGGSSIIQECLVEIDGVAINSEDETVAEKLSAMTVNDIESIDVSRFASASSYGARSANGVITIKTRMGEKPEPRAKINRDKLQSVRLGGYSMTEDFQAPDYSSLASDDDRVDLRSTIYWNPVAVTTGKDPLLLSFYAADVPTRYRIVVEGVTAEGEAVRGEKIIVISRNNK